MNPAHKQCCTLPPVQAEYTPKGSFGELDGLKTYQTGPTDTGKAILMVYDVFGFAPQILQGADLLASAGYRVVMPDFLKGAYAEGSMFDGTPEGDAKKIAYITGPGKPDSEGQAVAIAAALAALKAQGYASVGTVGFCWGWKAAITAKDVNQFSAIAGVHPSFVGKDDYEGLDIPVCLLPSGGEDKETVDSLYASLEKKNPGKNFLKWYPNEAHGWCAARGDLSGGEHTDAYAEAYQLLVNFFNKYV